MNRTWLLMILIISFILLALLKAREVSSLQTYFRSAPVIKLQRFQTIKKQLPTHDQELLELWESMLTGRSAPLSKWMKERYQILGLNHLFTPSGFHLSAVLLPFMKFIKSTFAQLLLLISIGIGLIFVPGMVALKRMVLIKSQQKILGLHIGFIMAIICDVVFGSFNSSPLSFSYSFLFLGIIYSGVRGVGLVFWFFTGQMILAFFQGNMISPLLLIFSPIINFCFALTMPLLFVFAFPLWSWQLHSGLFILKLLQSLVDLSAQIIQLTPSWEIHSGVMILLICFLFRYWKVCLWLLCLQCSSLNLDLQRTPRFSRYEFKPQGNIIRIVSKEEKDLIYFSDGKCARKLVRGFWWENCSPKRRSNRNKRTKLVLRL